LPLWEKWYVNFNSKEFGPFEGILRDSIRVQKDMVSFTVKDGKRWSIYLNDRKIGTYDFVFPFSIQIAPCGHHIIFSVENKGHRKVILDGKEIVECERILTETEMVQCDTEEAEKTKKWVHFNCSEKKVIFYYIKGKMVFREEVKLE